MWKGLKFMPLWTPNRWTWHAWHYMQLVANTHTNVRKTGKYSKLTWQNDRAKQVNLETSRHGHKVDSQTQGRNKTWDHAANSKPCGEKLKNNKDIFGDLGGKRSLYGPCIAKSSSCFSRLWKYFYIYIYNVKSIQKYAKSILPPSSTSFPMADVFLHVWTQSPAWPGSRLQWSTPNSGQCPPSRPHLLIDGPRLSLSVLCRMTRVHAGELILLWSNRATKQFYLHISRVSMLKLHYMKYRKYMEIRIGQFLWKFWLSSEPSPERCRTSPSESSSFATWNCSRFNAFDVQSANPRLQWLFSTKIP